MTSGSIIAICISGYAALIATCVFVWNVYTALSDKGKVKVGGFFGHVVNSSGQSTKILYFEFVNSGRKPITITTFGGDFKKKFIKGDAAEFVVTTPGIPIRLEPGERHQITFFNFDIVDETIKRMFVVDTLSNKHNMKNEVLRNLLKNKKALFNE